MTDYLSRLWQTADRTALEQRIGAPATITGRGPILTLYRKAADVAAYHLPRRDWITSGKAECGADLARPGFYDQLPADQPLPPYGAAGRRICGHCARRHLKTLKETN